MSTLKVKQWWTILLTNSIQAKKKKKLIYVNSIFNIFVLSFYKMKSNKPKIKSICTWSMSIDMHIYVYTGLYDRRQNSEVISMINYMAFRIKYTRNDGTNNRVHALSIVYTLYILTLFNFNLYILYL